jgi:hypothetical protein
VSPVTRHLSPVTFLRDRPPDAVTDEERADGPLRHPPSWFKQKQQLGASSPRQN